MWFTPRKPWQFHCKKINIFFGMLTLRIRPLEWMHGSSPFILFQCGWNKLCSKKINKILLWDFLKNFRTCPKNVATSTLCKIPSSSAQWSTTKNVSSSYRLRKLASGIGAKYSMSRPKRRPMKSIRPVPSRVTTNVVSRWLAATPSASPKAHPKSSVQVRQHQLMPLALWPGTQCQVPVLWWDAEKLQGVHLFKKHSQRYVN